MQGTHQSHKRDDARISLMGGGGVCVWGGGLGSRARGVVLLEKEGGERKKDRERDLFPPQRSRGLGRRCNGRPTRKII